MVACVCPYGIIALNPKALANKGVTGSALFFSNLFPKEMGAGFSALNS